MTESEYEKARDNAAKDFGSRDIFGIGADWAKSYFEKIVAEMTDLNDDPMMDAAYLRDLEEFRSRWGTSHTRFFGEGWKQCRNVRIKSYVNLRGKLASRDAMIEKLKGYLIEIRNECECTELCLCSSVNKETAVLTLADLSEWEKNNGFNK